jgi:hypothetical protein
VTRADQVLLELAAAEAKLAVLQRLHRDLGRLNSQLWQDMCDGDFKRDKVRKPRRRRIADAFARHPVALRRLLGVRVLAPYEAVLVTVVQCPTVSNAALAERVGLTGRRCQQVLGRLRQATFKRRALVAATASGQRRLSTPGLDLLLDSFSGKGANEVAARLAA